MARNTGRKATAGGRGDLSAALLFLAPNFLGFLLFVAFPILFSLGLVFTNWSLKPAVETRFIGLANIWALVGFRHADGAAGGAVILVAFFAAYLLLLAGIIGSLIGLGRQWNGVRGGGFLLAINGVLLFAYSVLTQSSVGWALMGLTLLMASLFFIVSESEGWVGRGLAGPAALALACVLVRVLRDPFLETWRANDPNFYKYLYNTLYLMFVIPLQIAGSLGLAMFLGKPLVRTGATKRTIATAIFALIAFGGLTGFWLSGHPDAGVLWATFWGIAALGVAVGQVALRTIFFLPSFTAGVAIMLLWKQMYNPEFGPLNEMLRLFVDWANLLPGIEWDPALPEWLHDPHWAKPALILMGFWTVVGGTNMLIYLAGLANIPEQLYEAARIDGANKWQEFRAITWPQLAPTTFFIVIMSLIAGLQGGFEQARVMTQGRPAGTTKTLSYYIYERAFEELSLGYASAIAWVMFVLIFVLTAMNWKFGNQYVNE
ncbi:MAG: multiple sugar transport system permease protein [Candidatus Sumerlaeota bacterium]|nr:multiple sugar transport system permease protein [Candidatus Sumerlaeota bacterium]